MRALGVENTTEGTKLYATLTDGTCIYNDRTKSYCVSSNQRFIYAFERPARLDAVRLYGVNWDGRNNIAVTSVIATDGDGIEHVIGTDVSYDPGGGAGYAILANADGSPLMERTLGLELRFATQENGHVGYAEFEAVGEPLDFYRVLTDPADAAVTTPAVGWHALTRDAALSLSAPTGGDDLSGRFTATCTGYQLVWADGTTASDTAASLEITPAQPFTLTWLYSFAPKAGVEPDASRRLLAAYVRNGLVAHYDGLFNQGTNAAHSTTATSWAELTGNAHALTNMYTSSGAAIALPTWDANGAVWAGTSAGEALGYRTGSGETLVADARQMTLEIVASAPWMHGANNRGMFMMADSSGGWADGNGAFNLRYCSVVYANGRIWNGQSGINYGEPTMSGCNDRLSSATAYVFDGTGVSTYWRGRYHTQYLRTLTKASAHGLFLGGGYTSSYTGGFKGTVCGLRVYDRALTADEILRNHAVDRMRYMSEISGDAPMNVKGDPGNYGLPEPWYGVRAASLGATVALSAGPTLVTYADSVRASRIDDTARAAYVGYRGLTNGVEVVSGSGETGTWTLPTEPVDSLAFEWRWRVDYVVSATNSGYAGSTVQVGDAAAGFSSTIWATNGATIAIKAIPAAGGKFVTWSGDTAAVADPLSAETTVSVSAARSLTAVFAEAYHEPVTVMAKDGVSGDWHSAATWEGDVLPQTGDTVLIGGGAQLTLSASPPHLAKLVVSNSVGAATSEIVCANWDTCLDVDDVVVGAGGIIRATGGFHEGESSNRVWIAANTLTVERAGFIRADACGWAPGNGPCREGSRTGSTGGAYGGLAGDQYSGYASTSASSARKYGDVEWPYDPGCGASSSEYDRSDTAKSGGGAIFLDVEGAVVIDGGVSACGVIANGEGGGSGGGILINCTTIDGSGSVEANAADILTGLGGGGGGRIAVHYDASAQAAKDATCAVAFRARGGYARYACSTEPQSSGTCQLMMRMGGPGTLWFTDNRFLGSAGYGSRWPFSGEWHSGSEDRECALPAKDVVMEDDFLGFGYGTLTNVQVRSFSARGTWGRTRGLVITNSVFAALGDARLDGASVKAYGALFRAGGDLTLVDSDVAYTGGELWGCCVPTNATQRWGAEFACGGTLWAGSNAIIHTVCHSVNGSVPSFRALNFYLAETALVEGRGRGYGYGLGPGCAPNGAASHGGRSAGDYGYDYSSICYGDEKYPTTPGSGRQSAGGGAFVLTAPGWAKIDGQILMTVYEGTGRPGSGGGILLDVGQIRPSKGTLDVSGRSDIYSSGGGRLAILHKVGHLDGLTCKYAGGTSTVTRYYEAGSGTFYVKKSFRPLVIILR